MMKKITSYSTVVWLIMLAHNTFAQNNADANRKQMMDSLKHVFLTLAAIDNPVLRQLTISTDLVPSSNIRSYLYGRQVFQGKINQERTNALFNVTVKSWGKNSVSASFSVFQQYFHFSDIDLSQTGSTDFNGKSISKFTVAFTPSYLRVDSLFGHQVIYTASISFLTNNVNSVKKVSYLGGVIFTLKQTQVTRTSLGFLINIDPSINIPVLPVFTYWHNYGNGLEININLPQQLMVKKIISPQFWATFGTAISGSVAFFAHTEPGLPKESIYSTIDLRTGPGMEYRFAKKLIFSLRGGLITPIQAREFDRTTSSGNYFLKNKIDNAPFVNISISVLPFL